MKQTKQYEYVDLGLPSGLKWATCNIGASKPEEYGLYFQWGDTVGYTADQVGSGEGKKYFDWTDYKYNNSGTSYPSPDNMTKYNSVDNLTVLQPEDDAAVVNMGGSWRMPTVEEHKELKHNTINDWVINYNGSGVNGWLFTSKVNGKSLFFPAAGSFNDGAVHDPVRCGSYWTSSIVSFDMLGGYLLDFSYDYWYMENDERCYGFPIRAVTK